MFELMFAARDNLRGDRIIKDEYNLVQLDDLEGEFNISCGGSLEAIFLSHIPVYLRLHAYCNSYHKYKGLVIRISYTPFYEYFYKWPCRRFEFLKFQLLNSKSIREHCACRMNFNIFREILDYIEMDNNKKCFIGKKYGLK